MGWLLSLCIPSNNFKHSWRPSSQQSRITYDVWSQIHWIDHKCLRMQASYTNYAVGLVTYIDLFNWTHQRSNVIANMLISKLGVNLIAIFFWTKLDCYLNCYITQMEICLPNFNTDAWCGGTTYNIFLVISGCTFYFSLFLRISGFFTCDIQNNRVPCELDWKFHANKASTIHMSVF